MKRNRAEDTSLGLPRPSMRKPRTEDERLLTGAGQEPPAFTSTDPWRVFRIMGEFVEGFDTLADLERAVTIFGSARTAPDDPIYQSAVEVARALGEAGFATITGGGPGIMEAGNRGAQEAEARSVGLNIELPFEQHVNPYVNESFPFHYFFARQTTSLKYASAFVIFPGGFGTMDEFFESMTLIQTGKMRRFPVVLFGTDYWGGLLDWIRATMLKEGKISECDMDLFLLTDSTVETCDFIIRSADEDPTRDEQEERARQVTEGIFGKR